MIEEKCVKIVSKLVQLYSGPYSLDKELPRVFRRAADRTSRADGLKNLYKYVLTYLRRIVEEDWRYQLALNLEVALNRQLQKIFIVSTHNYHYQACKYAEKLLQIYRQYVDYIVKSYINTAIEIHREYEGYAKQFNLSTISLDYYWRERNEYYDYLDLLEEVVKYASSVSEASLVKREKNRLLKLLSKVYDNIYNSVKYHPKCSMLRRLVDSIIPSYKPSILRKHFREDVFMLVSFSQDLIDEYSEKFKATMEGEV